MIPQKFRVVSTLLLMAVVSVSSFQMPSSSSSSGSSNAFAASTTKTARIIPPTTSTSPTINQKEQQHVSLFSDIPREGDQLQKEDDKDSTSGKNPLFDFFQSQSSNKLPGSFLGKILPPPPEDQFIMTGDICVLFFYAFTSHSLNDWIVSSMLRRHDLTVLQAVHSLDPNGDIVKLQQPVWVQTQNQYTVDHVLSVNAQESLLNHWGPLFATEGSACVALCTCWLLAGWLHRAFLFQNSVDCTTDRALQKTVETWISTALMMIGLAIVANVVVEHVPLLENALCVHQPFSQAAQQALVGMTPSNGYMYGEALTIPVTDVAATASAMTVASVAAAKATATAESTLTKADIMFIVDSMTVLIAWRFMANKMMNLFR